MAISKIVQNSLSDTISLGPKISSVQIANSTYVVKDDTNINIGGGYIVITGSGFQSNCSVIVDSNLACSVAFVSSTQIRAELPAKPAGTYNIYLLNGDGGTAIRVNALQYSNTPTWVTTSPLTSQQEDSNVSIQLAANGANTYSLQAGSTLPTGLTLSANGLISGLVNTNVSVETTFNFTVEAIDIENQETPKAFAVTITVSEPYFYQTVLLLDGDGTNGANNNVFRDSSNNNFTVTRNGNPTQGSFSPYSPAGFGAYFDGSDDSYSVPESADFRFGSGDFTMEAWLWIETNANSQLAFHWNGTTTGDITGSTNVLPNQWNHCAITRTGTTIRFWINGVQDSAGALTVSSTIYNNSDPLYIGRGADHSAGSGRDICHCGEVGGGANKWFWYLRSGGTGFFKGYMSNFRISNSVRYTTTFTPSTVDLTNDANTKLLTLNRNGPLDLSSSARVVTPIAGVRTINFSPFAPTTQYSVASHVGSAYFDQSGDYLSIPGGSHFQFASNAFTVEAWVYIADEDTRKYILGPGNNSGDHYDGIGFEIWDNRLSMWASSNGTSWDMLEADTSGNRGNILIRRNTWTHVAMTRSGNTWRSFVNGVVDRTFTVSGTVYYSASVPYNVGRTGYLDGSFYYDGYISQLRVTNGTALYTSNFSVPTTPLVPVTNTGVLLNFTNADIYDWTTRSVIETSGNVSLNTAVKKYGTGSIAFDGNADILKTTPGISHLYAFGKQDFTVEGWFYFNALGNYSLIDWRSSPSSNDPAFYTDASGYVGWYVNAASRILSAAIPAANQWHHLAVSRSGTSTKLFINGTQSGSTYTDTFDYGCADGRPWFGALSDGTGTLYYNGLIDNVRITKGYARYTANFTPPTQAFVTR